MASAPVSRRPSPSEAPRPRLHDPTRAHQGLRSSRAASCAAASARPTATRQPLAGNWCRRCIGIPRARSPEARSACASARRSAAPGSGGPRRNVPRPGSTAQGASSAVRRCRARARRCRGLPGPRPAPAPRALRTPRVGGQLQTTFPEQRCVGNVRHGYRDRHGAPFHVGGIVERRRLTVSPHLPSTSGDASSPHRPAPVSVRLSCLPAYS